MFMFLLLSGAFAPDLAVQQVPPAVGSRSTTLVFQQGLDGYQGTMDTFIETSDPLNSNGALESLFCDTDEPDGTGNDNYVLIRFEDLFGTGPGLIPLDAGIISATFSFDVATGFNGGPFQDVAVDWDEDTTWSTFGPSPGVQSSDRHSSLIGQVWLGNGNGTLTPRDVNVRESVMRWQADPPTNHGWILQAYGSPSYGEILSSEYQADPLLRPRLTVVINETGQPVLLRRPYVQNPTPTSITIMWQTDLACSSRIVVGAAPGEEEFEIIDPALVRNHEVEITGLQPGQTYYYSIGTSDDVLDGGDEQAFFRTSPIIGEPARCTIWAFGDAGRYSQTQFDVRDTMLEHLGNETPDIILNLGDVAYNFCSDGDLTTNMFSVYGDVLRHAPMLPTTGSHEQQNNNVNSGLGPYFDAFSLPASGEAGGVPSGREAYFSCEYGDVHIVCLTALATVSPTSHMVQWLQNDLAAADAGWVIVYFNHGPYSAGPHDSDTDSKMTSMREVVMPVLEQYGVDLVLGGYSHNYERSYLIDGAYDTPTTAAGHIVDSGDGRPSGDGAYEKQLGMVPHDGTVCVIAGHGAGGGSSNTHPLMGFSSSGGGSCLVRIENNVLEFINLQSTGEITDEFVIVKKDLPDCAADYTLDSQVDIDDLLVVISGWSDPYNVVDLLLVIQSWGPCP